MPFAWLAAKRHVGGSSRLEGQRLKSFLEVDLKAVNTLLFAGGILDAHRLERVHRCMVISVPTIFNYLPP